MGQVEEICTAYNNLCDKLCEVEENNKHLQTENKRMEEQLAARDKEIYLLRLDLRELTRRSIRQAIPERRMMWTE